MTVIIDEPEGQTGDLPTLWFTTWKEGVLAKLPAPTVPFALRLNETPLDDNGLREVARFSTLQTLYLYRTRLTDGGLKELVALKNLQELDLGQNAVTDAGLTHLAELKALRSLSLRGTQVTETGVNGLRQALPECKI